MFKTEKKLKGKIFREREDIKWCSFCNRNCHFTDECFFNIDTKFEDDKFEDKLTRDLLIFIRDSKLKFFKVQEFKFSGNNWQQKIQNEINRIIFREKLFWTKFYDMFPKHRGKKTENNTFSNTQSQIGFWYALGLPKSLLFHLVSGVKIRFTHDNLPNWDFEENKF